MNIYPVNLVLAVAAGSSTIFLGFLPAETLRSGVLARETLKAAIAWGFIAIASPAAITHYPLIIAGLCLVAWNQFRKDEALVGKMWLSMGSGLGISVGVMLILAGTPLAYPLGISTGAQIIFLCSVYLGGSIIGLAHVSGILLQAGTVVKRAVTQRYVTLLLILVIARVVVLILRLLRFDPSGKGPVVPLPLAWPTLTYDLQPAGAWIAMVAAGLVFILPVLAFGAWRAVRAQLPMRAQWFLLVLTLLALFVEVMVRDLAL